MIKCQSLLNILCLLSLFFFISTDASYAQQQASFNESRILVLDESVPLSNTYEASISDFPFSEEQILSFFKRMSDPSISFTPNLSEGKVLIEILIDNPNSEVWNVSDWNRHLYRKTQRSLAVFSN